VVPALFNHSLFIVPFALEAKGHLRNRQKPRLFYIGFEGIAVFTSCVFHKQPQGGKVFLNCSPNLTYHLKHTQKTTWKIHDSALHL